ncbi:MAG: adenine nucleotide alpha hydrolase [Acidobacteriaceae bacterium]|nr:adenine nucleotide alpha hydrolase [Acidobacteriaceae bacterium]
MRVVLSWSSGKDSAWALHLLRQMPEVELVSLITTFNQSADRVAMHAVRRSLVMAQAEQVGLPLWPVELPWPCSNQDYECLMRGVCEQAVSAGATHIAFGDLYLEDVRAYRLKQLQQTGLAPLFPLWKLPTAELALEMVRSGVRAKVTCVDPKQLDPQFAGRDFDATLLTDLPGQVDPCGENGEFHTFVYDAPQFRNAIPIRSGEVVKHDGFVFADVVPAESMRAAIAPARSSLSLAAGSPDAS